MNREDFDNHMSETFWWWSDGSHQDEIWEKFKTLITRFDVDTSLDIVSGLIGIGADEMGGG